MRVLAVTGRLAEGLVRKHAGGADVLVLDVDVASFITPEMLKEAAPEGYDVILIPGAITADFSSVEEEIGSRIFLGPKHAADIGLVIDRMGALELSRTVPACVLLEGVMRGGARKRIDEIEAAALPSLAIRGVKIGGRSRMKVLAEVVDATKIGIDALKARISYFQSEGCDMIDLGLPLDARPSDVAKVVDAAREATRLPLSIDTVNPRLIMAGLDAGVDMILSLNGENLPAVGKAVAGSGTPAVLIPGPRNLEENLRAATDLGIKAIADPVLSPPLAGLAESLQRYIDFGKEHPDVPMFFGAGNVTELLDADTQGSNALLAALASEVKASILFTPEHSTKARGSVFELRRASEMMLLASDRGTPPKDLAIDLLRLKEKRGRPEFHLPPGCICACESAPFQEDPAGSFQIFVADGMIVARHPRACVAGRRAKEIIEALTEMGLVTMLDHAGYLGRELSKAEIALDLSRSYTQDEPLFSERI